VPGNAAAAKKYLNVSNRFRRASNPALNKQYQLTPAQRQNGTASPLRQHNQLRHPPASRYRHHIGNSALPPLPPMSTNARSVSLDGLLDSTKSEASQWQEHATSGTNKAAEGLTSSKNNCENISMTDSINQSNSNNKDAIRNTTNRRSKSLDDLLDDDDSLLIIEDGRETQSMENILENSDCKKASNESIEYSVSPVPSEKMCEKEVLVVENAILMPKESEDASRNDSGIHCDSNDSLATPKLNSDNNSLDDDTISNSISISSSTNSDKKSGKALINKYVKKVKNFIKK
jgi:hypothetical protein